VFPDVPGVSSQDLASDDADRKITALKKHGFTEGLARALLENCAAFPIRFWIIDNSYSMAERDGHRVVETSGVSSSNVHYAACTRWEEIQECVVYHAEVSALLKAPTRFRVSKFPLLLVFISTKIIWLYDRHILHRRRLSGGCMGSIVSDVLIFNSPPLTLHTFSAFE